MRNNKNKLFIEEDSDDLSTRDIITITNKLYCEIENRRKVTVVLESWIRHKKFLLAPFEAESQSNFMKFIHHLHDQHAMKFKRFNYAFKNEFHYALEEYQEAMILLKLEKPNMLEHFLLRNFKVTEFFYSHISDVQFFSERYQQFIFPVFLKQQFIINFLSDLMKINWSEILIDLESSNFLALFCKKCIKLKNCLKDYEVLTQILVKDDVFNEKYYNLIIYLTTRPELIPWLFAHEKLVIELSSIHSDQKKIWLKEHGLFKAQSPRALLFQEAVYRVN